MWCFGRIEVCLDPVFRCRASGARVWDLHFLLRKKGGVRGGSRSRYMLACRGIPAAYCRSFPGEGLREFFDGASNSQCFAHRAKL